MKKFFKQEIDFFGKPLSIETGKYAKQADGAIWCKYGNTVLLATAVASREEITEERDFFPLTVDYVEKFYAAGRFPGGFLKRESQPSTEEKLTSRIIDRPIRPLFPKWFVNETQILVTLLSHDEACDPKVVSVMAASAALMISDIPFHGPIAACRIIKKDGEYIINPTITSNEANLKLNIIMAGNRDSIVMVEGEALEATEEEVMEALSLAHKAIQPVLDMQIALAEQVAPEKRPEIVFTEDSLLRQFVFDQGSKPVKDALSIREKLTRYKTIDEVKKSVVAAVKKAVEEGVEFLDKNNPDKVIGKAKYFFEQLLKYSMRGMITKDEVRIDGRDMTTIRPIWIELGVLPNVHGSAIFTRGETQSLGTLTLGIGTDEQRVDTVTDEYSKPFMLHYNFPPFSVGEVGRLKSPGRREIGHGFLAERALKALVPAKTDFPYTVRIVSEVLESNGSSSMATVCSGSLALHDGGVPVKSHVAGIAMGLIKENEDYFILSDIMGDEDHLGDMDFKVAGTKDGITAIQMDIKIEGLPEEVMERALLQAKQGRMHIIRIMEEAIPTPRAELSEVAPKLQKLTIDTDKIRDLIGTGGKNIKAIVEATGASIDVQQDGTVTIATKDNEALQKTIALVRAYTGMVEVGKIYDGVVSRIEEYGAFVDIMDGIQTGLLHISKISEERINKVEDVLNLGDNVKVVVTQIEQGGKFRISMKPTDLERDWIANPEERHEPRERSHHDRGGSDSRDRRDRRDRRN